MQYRRKRHLPKAMRQKLALLDTFFALSSRRRHPTDKTAALALLVEYAGGAQPQVVPIESGRCYICTFPATWIREAIPGLGFTRRNKILLCQRHNEELESLLIPGTEQRCEPPNQEYRAIVSDCART